MLSRIGFIGLSALTCAAGDSTDPGLLQAVEQLSYSVEASTHGTYRANNPAQQLAVEFSAQETALRHPHGDVALRLTGYGYGTHLRQPAEVKPTINANRVEYRRGELTEWYVNDSRGLEQGFTLHERPGAAHPGQPLVIALAVDGDLRPTPAGDSVLLGSALRYGGLRAWDAQGRSIASRLEMHDREIRLIVEDSHAEYPLVVDPLLNQQAELIAPNGSLEDNFGWSVAVSGDTALIGAPNKQIGANTFQGAAYVFVRGGGSSWTLQQRLAAFDGATSDNFGKSVSLSGNTAIVGAKGNQSDKGAAYIFVRAGATWALQQKITASDGVSGDLFGWSVAVNGDTAIIGARSKTIGPYFTGAAYIFVRSGSTWTWVQELTPSDGASDDAFGFSVALSGDTAVVGADQHGPYQGSVYVFVRSGASTGPWIEQQELGSPDPQGGDHFGWSVSLSGDTIVVGAPGDNGPPVPGAAYVFVRGGGPSGTWTLQQELTASDGTAWDLFGSSVSVSGDTAVIGAPTKNGATPGAAYVFTRSGGLTGTWAQQQELIPSDGVVGDVFGSSVALSGGTVLVGAPSKFIDPNTGQGAAYVFLTIGAVSVIPNGGGGLSETFTAVYTDLNGTADLQVVYLSFGTSAGAAHGCWAAYVQSNNTLLLFNDAGTGTVPGTITPGGGGTLSNSQCTLSGGGGAVSPEGADLIVPFAITFAPGFTGSKKVFGLAQNYGGSNSGWQPLGVWTPAPAPPLRALSVSPNSGAGLTQTFTAVFTDPNGATDLQVVYLDFTPTVGGAQKTCFVVYIRGSNALYLYGDIMTSLLGPIIPGTSVTVSNSQCTLSGSGGVATTSGNNLTLPLSITFKPAFSGLKDVYGLAQNYAGQGGWELLGTWTPAPAALGVMSVTPINGSGFGPQTFTAIYTDPNGASDLQVVYLDFGTSIFAANTCIVGYIPANNQLFLYNDSSTGVMGFTSAGGTGSMSNSQCTVSGDGGTVMSAGNNLIVPFNITFKPGFAGSKNVYGLAQSYGGTQSAWVNLGTWNP